MPRPFLRLLPGILVSLAFALWFARAADWSAVTDSLVGATPGFVVLSAMVLFTEFFIRTLRWRVLLGPLQTPEGSAPDLRFGRLLTATLVGMSLNVTLPFRAGDLARPFLGSRETGLSMAPLVTIAVMERVFDILGLVFVLLVMVFTLPEAGGAQGELVYNLKLYGGVLGGLGFLGLGVMLGASVMEERAHAGFRFLARFLPGPIQGRVLALFDGLVDGLGAIRSVRRVFLAAALSAVHWMNGALSIYLLFWAFSMELPFSAACFTTVAIALAAAMPQAPGFFGVFHKAAETTMVLWGQDEGPAKAFAITLWFVSFLPIALTGTLLFWREGLSLADFGYKARES